MITKRMNVYYCDYCGKRYLSASWMTRHERGCTANPNRHCGICESDGPYPLADFDKYLEPMPMTDCFEGAEHNGVRRVIDGQYDDFIGAVETVADCCPACMLAIIRQLRIKRIPWEFTKARDDYWADVNEEEFKREHQNEYYM